MTTYRIDLLATAAQTFSAQLGDFLFTIKMQWMNREQAFRVDILFANGVVLTAGRILNVGSNLLAGTFPTPAADVNYGSLMLIGDEATVDNLGINNTLVYTDG